MRLEYFRCGLNVRESIRVSLERLAKLQARRETGSSAKKVRPNPNQNRRNRERPKMMSIDETDEICLDSIIRRILDF